MKVCLDSLNRRVRLGMIKLQVDNKDLLIYSYTDKCQFEKRWDRQTRMARSLIVNTQGQVVCKTFEKFFNLNERPETLLENLPNEPYEIYEKLDGSLLQLFYYQGEWRLSTRGSFDNEFTQFARRCLPDLSSLPTNHCYAFEVCLPNELDGLRRAVSHRPGIYFLAAFDRDNDFKELDWFTEGSRWFGLGASTCRAFGSNTSLQDLVASSKDDTEGWVVRFKSGLRIKIKTAWYMKMWRVPQKLDEKHIKEFMAAYNGNDYAWQVGMPEELLPEIKGMVRDIRNRMRWQEEEAKAKFERAMKGCTSKKEFAMKVKDDPQAWILFSMYDGRNYQEKLLSIV